MVGLAVRLQAATARRVLVHPVHLVHLVHPARVHHRAAALAATVAITTAVTFSIVPAIWLTIRALLMPAKMVKVTGAAIAIRLSMLVFGSNLMAVARALGRLQGDRHPAVVHLLVAHHPVRRHRAGLMLAVMACRFGVRQLSTRAVKVCNLMATNIAKIGGP